MSSTRWICALRTSCSESGRHSSPSEVRGGRCCRPSGKSGKSMKSPVAVMLALEITFSSSLTFPGQGCCSSTACALRVSPEIFFAYASLYFFKKKNNEAYAKKISGLTRRAQAVQLQHPWPGNVRELENVISSASITATGDFIDLPDLPEGLQQRPPRTAEGEEWRPLSLQEVRKAHIHPLLDMCQGNPLRAAQALGVGRTSLYPFFKHAAPEKPARGGY